MITYATTLILVLVCSVLEFSMKLGCLDSNVSDLYNQFKIKDI